MDYMATLVAPIPPPATTEMPRGIAIPRLRELREAAFLTQAELADQAEIARNVIVSAENGGTVRISTARKLAAALGVPPGALTAKPQEG